MDCMKAAFFLELRYLRASQSQEMYYHRRSYFAALLLSTLAMKQSHIMKKKPQICCRLLRAGRRSERPLSEQRNLH